MQKNAQNSKQKKSRIENQNTILQIVKDKICARIERTSRKNNKWHKYYIRLKLTFSDLNKSGCKSTIKISKQFLHKKSKGPSVKWMHLT